jgi:hypothetical protein
MKLAAVIWPEKSGEYKVVQIFFHGKAELLFQNETMRAHSRILENFLKKNEVPYETIDTIPEEINRRKLTPEEIEEKGWMIPATHGREYNCPGMGKVNLDVENKIAYFGGSSVDYKIGIDRKHLSEIQKICSDYKFR